MQTRHRRRTLLRGESAVEVEDHLRELLFVARHRAYVTLVGHGARRCQQLGESGSQRHLVMVLADAPQQGGLPPAPLLEALRREVGGGECNSLHALELTRRELSGPALHLSGQPFRSLFRQGRRVGRELRLGEVALSRVMAPAICACCDGLNVRSSGASSFDTAAAPTLRRSSNE